MSNEPITWDNIPGLTDEKREAGKKFLNTDDLRGISIGEGNSVDGVPLPKIENGVVIR